MIKNITYKLVYRWKYNLQRRTSPENETVCPYSLLNKHICHVPFSWTQI